MYLLFISVIQPEIARYRQAKGMTCRGRSVPKPVFAFDEPGFPGNLLN